MMFTSEIEEVETYFRSKQHPLSVGSDKVGKGEFLNEVPSISYSGQLSDIYS